VNDPLLSTFDTLVGALASARALLGRPITASQALVATGRAFALTVDDHLRVVPPSPDEIDAALRALGVRGEPIETVSRLREHGGLSLLWGVSGNAFGLVLRREGEELVARSPLAARETRVPLARLGGEKLVSILLHGLGEEAPVAPAAAARAELARPSSYRAWARILARHPLSRLDPEGNAWLIARATEARVAAATVAPGRELARELAILAELGTLFPLPEGGSLSAERTERGAALLDEAAALERAWLGRLAGS